MKNPYQILGVSESSTDETIRKAWLEKVRQYSPETAPEKFKEIRDAFEKIKSKPDRLRHFLFSTDCYIDSPVEALTAELEDISKRRPPSLKFFQNLISQTFNQLK